MDENIPIVNQAPKKPVVKRVRKSRAKATTDLSLKQKANPKTAPVKKVSRSTGIYRKIAISFIALTILFIAAILYFSVVKVSIVIVPSQEKLNDNLTVSVYDQAKASQAGDRDIIGVVKQVDVLLNKTYPVSGKEVLGAEVTGKVTIINNYTKNQPLVASTRLLTVDNKLFRVKTTVNVPAGGQIEVEVYADETKPEMAIGPANFTIPGLWAGLQDKIFGQSKTAMTYSEKVKKTITQNDIDLAVKDLKENLVSQAKDQIGATFKDYDQVIYQIDNNSVSQQFDGKVGEEKAGFNAQMKTKVSVVAFKDDKVYELAGQKLTSALPDDKSLIEFNKKDLTYSLNNINLSQGLATVNVAVSGKMSLKSGASIIDRNKLVGLTGEQLKQYLNKLPEIAGYEIKFSPSFIKKVPSLVDRISIEIKK